MKEAKRVDLFASNHHEALLDNALHAVLVVERHKPKACMTDGEVRKKQITMNS